MKSLAERALCVIESRLRGIRTEDGYATDAGLNVFRARRKLGTDECPAAVVWDLGETVTASQGSRDEIDLLVGIEVHVPAGDCGSLLEAVKADAKRTVRPTANKDVLRDSPGTIRYDGAVLFAREDGAETESITLKFIVHYTEVVGDPTSTGNK